MTNTEVIAFLGLGMNAAAVIWGAAKLSSAVEHLKETVAEIKEIAMNVQNIVHNLMARVYVLEDRAGIAYREDDNIHREHA